MKKAISFILIVILCLSFVACVNDSETGENEQGEGGQTENPLPDENEKEEDNQEEPKSLELIITINGIDFIAVLCNNPTAKALTAMLPMTVNMSELNGNEKYYYLPGNLPISATNPGYIDEGDIMLYGSNCLVLFYKSFSTSYSYTKIGKIEDAAGLAAALGTGNVVITFSINK